MKLPSEKGQAEATAGPWAPYAPSDEAPWDLRRVVHLHRRAGFAATWDEIRRDLKDGPRASIDRILTGRAATAGVPRDFQRTADLLADSASDWGRPAYQQRQPRDPGRLKAWWVYRMLYGPDPLSERLALMWHNHFATSNLKVDDLAATRRQNDLFRKLGRGPFGELLRAVVRDRAMLVWLDAANNRKGHPNENLARELMELFSMGVGHYTEADVKEAARALTGWDLDGDAFVEVPASHDDGEKTILGRKGRWRGDDLVRMVLEHPATARRVAWRACELFLGEKALQAADVASLADGLRARELDVGWAVETVLRSRAFFAEDNLGDRVLSPAEYVVGAARALELFEPSCTLVLAEWCGRLGQDLFYPPNVGGWSGGRSWLTTQAIIGRANYAVALVEGQLSARPTPFDGLALAKRHDRGPDLDAALTFYAELLTGRPPAPGWKDRLRTDLGPKAAMDGDTVRAAIAVMVASPEVQLA